MDAPQFVDALCTVLDRFTRYCGPVYLHRDDNTERDITVGDIFLTLNMHMNEKDPFHCMNDDKHFVELLVRFLDHGYSLRFIEGHSFKQCGCAKRVENSSASRYELSFVGGYLYLLDETNVNSVAVFASK